jgi:hypothetical protein
MASISTRLSLGMAGVTLDDLPGGGIEGKLSAHEDESTAPESL